MPDEAREVLTVFQAYVAALYAGDADTALEHCFCDAAGEQYVRAEASLYAAVGVLEHVLALVFGPDGPVSLETEIARFRPPGTLGDVSVCVRGSWAEVEVSGPYGRPLELAQTSYPLTAPWRACVRKIDGRWVARLDRASPLTRVWIEDWACVCAELAREVAARCFLSVESVKPRLLALWRERVADRPLPFGREDPPGPTTLPATRPPAPPGSETAPRPQPTALMEYLEARQMFERFTNRARNVMALAHQEAQQFNHEQIGTGHILLGLVKEGNGLAAQALCTAGVDLRRARLAVQQLAPPGANKPVAVKLPQNPAVKQTVTDAVEEAGNLGHSYVGTEHILLGLLRQTMDVAVQALALMSASPDGLRQTVLDLLRAADPRSSADDTATATPPPPAPAPAPSLTADIIRRALEEPPADDEDDRRSSAPEALRDALERLSRRTERHPPPLVLADLTEQSRLGKLDPVVGREPEIERVIALLSRRRPADPVLIGPADVGRRSVAHGVAARIAAGGAPGLDDARVLAVDVATVAADARVAGQIRKAVLAVRVAGVTRPRAVFVLLEGLDAPPTPPTARAQNEPEPMAGVAAVAALLAQPDLRFIVTATADEYARFVRRFPSLQRRLTPVPVAGPTPAAALAMLRGLRDRYEAHHGVHLTDDALAAAVDCGVLYIPGRVLPGKAVDLIDDAAAAARAKTGRGSPDVVELNARIEETGRRKDEAVTAAEYDLAARLRDEQEALRVKREECLCRWRATPVIVDAAAVQAAAKRLATDPPKPPAAEPHPPPPARADALLGPAAPATGDGVALVLVPGVEAYHPVFDRAILPALAANGLSAHRPPHAYAADAAALDPLRADAWAAELVLADVAGRDPGVLFAVGVAAGAGRVPILLARTPADLPAGLRPGRFLAYDDTDAGLDDLRQRLTEAVRAFLSAARRRRDPP